MLKSDVFAASIANLTDARYFAAREAKWLSFCLDSFSSNFVNPTEVKAIKEWVDGVFIVGEFGDVDHSEIEEAVERIGLDGVQAGPFTSKEAIQSLSVPVFKEFVIEPDTTLGSLEQSLKEYAEHVDYFLLDFVKNKVDLHEHTKIEISDIAELAKKFPLVLTPIWSAEKTTDFLEIVQPKALLLRGGEEEKVGFKSFDELDDILDQLEVID